MPIAPPLPTRAAHPAARAVAALVLAAAAPTVRAQTPTAPAGGDHRSTAGPAVTGRDAATLGGVAAAAVALMAVDERVARWSQRRALQEHDGLRRTAPVFRALGDPGVIALGGATYLVGLARRDRATADVGLHTAGAIVVAGTVTGVIKAVAGRARPYVTGDTNAHAFSLGRGLRAGNAYQSFPSGHATAAFAFASALSAEGRHRWPTANRITAPLAYTAASAVALSRIYHDRHWASDVVLGAGIGFVTGRALVRYQHARPRNSADGRLLPPRRTVQLSPAAPTSLGWSIAF